MQLIGSLHSSRLVRVRGRSICTGRLGKSLNLWWSCRIRTCDRYLHITPETLGRYLAHLCKDDLPVLEQHRFALPDTLRARHLTQL